MPTSLSWKNRRNTLLKNAIKYYQFISRTVNISGTEENELFEIKQKDNKLNVAVYRLKEKKERGRKIYDRTFDYEDTKFINLAGYGGNDIFITEENTFSKIKLNIAGGDGKDVYDLKGKMKTVVNDSLNNGDEVVNNQRAKINFR